VYSIVPIVLKPNSNGAICSIGQPVRFETDRKPSKRGRGWHKKIIANIPNLLKNLPKVDHSPPGHSLRFARETCFRIPYNQWYEFRFRTYAMTLFEH